MTGGVGDGPLSRLRRAAGLTQEELAERAGLSVRSVRNLERDAVARPRTSTLRALGTGLGLGDAQLSDLVGSYRPRQCAAAQDQPDAPGTTPRASSWAAPSPDLPPAAEAPDLVVPLQLPPRPSPFTGRAVELAELDAALTGDVGTPRLAVLDGLAGAGKTALALAWAHTRLVSFADGVLYVDLHGSRAGRPHPTEAVLDRILSDLGIANLGAQSSAENRAALLRRTLAGRRMLVVLDDAGSAEQVRPLLPGPGACAALVTSRYQLRGLSIRDGARHVAVGPLADDDAAELVRNLLGPADLRGAPGAVDAIVRRCAGLPLALRIASDRLVRRPAAQAQAALDAWLAEPVPLDAFHTADDPGCDLRTVFAESYRRLTPEAARCLRLAGALPAARMTRAAVTASWNLTSRAANRVLAELTSTHLLEEPLPDRYEMHDLVREFVREAGLDEDVEPLALVSRRPTPRPAPLRPSRLPVELPVELPGRHGPRPDRMVPSAMPEKEGAG
ncbi:NB-ARC domain-containing protein [Promicromonospora sp. NPDC019610]|uniref:NB-ARC domain-containing protein n=1 Tax=Promicromonospora sp. NPDC019610 TaxID=3364405 RepID=UPI0037B0D729